MGSHYNDGNRPAGSLFGPPIHELNNRFSSPASLFPPSSSPPSHHNHHDHDHSHSHDDHDHDHHDHDHSHGHHDHDHDHHDSHDHSSHHDHDHFHSPPSHHASHNHDHDHHDHHHDDHDDHDHHDHDHSHGHHDHSHGHHDHSHSHSSTSYGSSKNSHVFHAHNEVSQRGSPALSSYNPSGSGMGGSNELLEPSAGGYVFTAPKSDGWVQEGQSWNHNYSQEHEVKTKASLAQYMKVIWIDKDAKNLFMFILLSTTFTCIEIMYGTMSNSLGLISEAFHTIFDNIAMVISLIALVLSRHEPNSKFTYGYDRIEILSGFANGAFLLFVSFFLFVESIERLLEPPELHSHGRVISVAFIGLLINAFGVVFFSRHSLHRSESTRNKARQDNMKIIMTHLFTDMLSGIGVIISSWLSQMQGWHTADTLISLFIAAMIVRNAWPICSRMARVLLQTTPDSIYPAINKCLREASTLEGVLEYHSEHFWTSSPGVFVGSLCVKVRSDANEQSVLQQVTKLFSPYIRHLTVQIEKDNWNL